jgi:hypothetical protein
MPYILLAVLMAAALIVSPSTAAASSRTHGKVIAGWVEKITLLPWGDIVSAKLDTGAMTSSIHATNVERFTRGKEKWVRFDIQLGPDSDSKIIRGVERPLARRVLVKQAGDDDHRLSVEMEICSNGQLRTVEFTLADRSDLIYPVILGRRFMKSFLVVDPSQTFLTKAACDELPVGPSREAD